MNYKTYFVFYYGDYVKKRKITFSTILPKNKFGAYINMKVSEGKGGDLFYTVFPENPIPYYSV